MILLVYGLVDPFAYVLAARLEDHVHDCLLPQNDIRVALGDIWQS